MLCQFCNLEFNPRPQVKHPRACGSSLCQGERQRTNEKDWRNLQSKTGSGRYDAVQRGLRNSAIKAIVAEILKCLGIGRRITGLPEFRPELSGFFTKIFLGLGIREINKFWMT